MPRPGKCFSLLHPNSTSDARSWNGRWYRNFFLHLNMKACIPLKSDERMVVAVPSKAIALRWRCFRFTPQSGSV